MDEVLFDEFALREWPGETKAAEEFRHGKASRIVKFP
jgi:hypothetical protein